MSSLKLAKAVDVGIGTREGLTAGKSLRAFPRARVGRLSELDVQPRLRLSAWQRSLPQRAPPKEATYSIPRRPLIPLSAQSPRLALGALNRRRQLRLLHGSAFLGLP